MSSSKERAAAIRRIKNSFQHGNQLDDAVLEAVLEMNGGNVNDTIQFLTAQNGDFVDRGSSAADALPANYMTKPAGWRSSLISDCRKEESEAIRLKNFFLQENTSFSEHYYEQQNKYSHYVATLCLLLNSGVSLGTTTKTRALAVAWARGDRNLAEHLLSLTSEFGFPELVRACKILDSPRRLKAYQKRLERLEKQGTAKKKTLGRIKNKIHDAQQDVPVGIDGRISVSGALCRRLRRWFSAIPASELGFFALQMPKQPWQEIADIIHPSPKDFSLEWFLPYMFGSDAPEDSLVSTCVDMSTAAKAAEITKQYEVPYSYLRTKVTEPLPAVVRARVARYEKLDMVLWYYEELSDGCPEVDRVIADRLAKGEEPSFSYGKFMERLMYFKQSGASFYTQLIPIAQRRLEAIDLPLEPPVVVLGDASYSMDVAIRTSTIIASLLTALCSADLKFFSDRVTAPDFVPRKVEDVLDVAFNTQADGLTAPACAIHDYYTKKEVVKCFVVVTDEIENEPFRGQFFAQLFYKYFTEVYPAQLVMVSFLDDPSKKGRMVLALEEMGIKPLQFRLHAKRPDLSKVDTLLGLLSAESALFTSRVNGLAKTNSSFGLTEMLEGMRPPEPTRNDVDMSSSSAPSDVKVKAKLTALSVSGLSSSELMESMESVVSEPSTPLDDAMERAEDEGRMPR